MDSTLAYGSCHYSCPSGPLIQPQAALANAEVLLGCPRDQLSDVAQYRQQAVFEAFCQANDSITRPNGGTGLGLAICDRYVQCLGGHPMARNAV
jgi:K+-sensing histidine kinase KdpD